MRQDAPRKKGPTPQRQDCTRLNRNLHTGIQASGNVSRVLLARVRKDISEMKTDLESHRQKDSDQRVPERVDRVGRRLRASADIGTCRVCVPSARSACRGFGALYAARMPPLLHKGCRTCVNQDEPLLT